MDFNSLKLEQHMRFVCPECGEELQTLGLWRKHINITHEYNKKPVEAFNFKKINERYHECNECHKWVDNGTQSITALQYHRISHLPFNLTFKCRYCMKAYARKRALSEHLVSNHQKFIDARQNEKLLNTIVQKSVTATNPLLIVHPPHNTSALKMASSATNMSNLNNTNIDCMEKVHKDPGDLIQKALLDSLIDLENENLSEFDKNVNDYALDQSLKDLEAILEGDLLNPSNNLNTVEQYTRSPILQQYPIEITTPNIQETNDFADVEDNELEQICADIFEEVLEPDAQENYVKSHQPDEVLDIYAPIPESANNNEIAGSENDLSAVEEPEEKIISIEINAINDMDRNEMFSSPKRKRLKIEVDPSNSQEINAKMKVLLLNYILYLCPECGREFKTQSSWKDHVFRVHDLANTIHAKFRALEDTLHKCLDCGEVLRTTKIHDLQRHRFTHMPFQSYLKCTFCDKTKSSKPKILQHLQSCHAQTLQTPEPSSTTTKSLSCPKCSKTFQSKLRFQGHYSSCTHQPKTIVKTSTKNFNDSSISSYLNLIAHLKKMRARMRTLLDAENSTAVASIAETTAKPKKSSHILMI